MSEATLNTEPVEDQGPKEISDMSSAQKEFSGTETEQSLLKVPESNGMSAEVMNEKEHIQKELNKFLAGQVVDEEGKMTVPQQAPIALPKQTQDSPGLKMTMINRDANKRERKRDLLFIERQRAQLEVSLRKNRSDIIRMDKTIEAKKRHLKQLEHIIEREQYVYEEFLKSSEKKLENATTLFEKENKYNREMNAEIEMLADKIGTLKSELAQIDEILNKYKRYKNILYKLSPPEWQEAEAFKTNDPSDTNTLDEHNREPQESAIRQENEKSTTATAREKGVGANKSLESSPGGVLPSCKEPTLSSDNDKTLVPISKRNRDNTDNEEKLEIFFSDPQPLLDLMMELTDQNLSLIQNSTRVDETLDELRQTIETAETKMKEDKENLTLQVYDMEDRIDKEKDKGAMLKKKVQLHDSLRTEDQDVLLDDLGLKVTEVHRCCVDSRLTNLSTLEKLSSVEYRMSLLLQLIESIPDESLETLRRIKDSERRNRQREEQLRLEREKQMERMKKCIKRSLGDSKKITGRRLMPRCIPVEQKVKVSEEDIIPAEDELHAYLFTIQDE